MTLTTVGYGDLVPATTVGRALSILLMLTGYGIIAVPAGIVTVELTRAGAQPLSTQAVRLAASEGTSTMRSIASAAVPGCSLGRY